MTIKEDGTRVYEYLKPDEITQVEAQAGKKVAELIDELIEAIKGAQELYTALEERVSANEEAIKDLDGTNEPTE